MANRKPKVGLFVTCLVDLFRPSVGFAAVKLLEDAGCEVDVPELQTCCGQPAYNSGDREDTKLIARQVMDAFAGHDYVVVPSGSCGGMISKHYPELFEGDPDLYDRALELAGRTHELLEFLVDVMGVERVEASYDGVVTYHDSCASLREIGLTNQARTLLDTVDGLWRAEMPDTEVCCGFGGTFCVKYPDISNKMVEEKAANVEGTGADTLLAGDLGCLMNIAGKLQRRGSKVRVRHVAEVLAGTAGEDAPIGLSEAEAAEIARAAGQHVRRDQAAGKTPGAAQAADETAAETADRTGG